MLNRLDLENCREELQNDLDCILDGLDEDIMDNVCQSVVDRINDLIVKLENDDA